MTSNKGVLQAERRDPLLRGEVLEDFMLDLFKDEIQEIERPLGTVEGHRSTGISQKNNKPSHELSEATKLRQAYYDFDREKAEREAEARRDALETEVYNLPEVQKRLKRFAPRHDPGSIGGSLVQSLEELKLDKR